MKSSYDVVVIGAGVAGVAASIAVAEQGATVLLLERYGVLGGLASLAAVGTICGAFLRDKDKLLWGCSNFVREFLSAANLLERSNIKIAKQGQIYIPYNISMFHNYCSHQLLKHKVDIELHSTVCGLKAVSKNIESLNYLSWNRNKQIQFKALVDASGEALSLNLLEAPSLDRYLAQAASLTVAAIGFNSGQDERTLNFELARYLELNPELKKLGKLSILPGSIRENYAELKYSYPIGTEAKEAPFSHTKVEIEARLNVSILLEQLSIQIPEFSKIEPVWQALQVGFRSGSVPICRETLSGQDVLSCRKRKDTVAVGCWPIEVWGLKGRAEFEFFNERDYYDISPDSLRSRDFDNLFFCGRSFGADEKALASARVIGTAMSTGFAAGRLAQVVAKHGGLNESLLDSVASDICEQQLSNLGQEL